ncbi:hypothetical protein NL676_009254 [Syzygium grande]|nr:hypothetical protein NL676_009254 [Syzygium grande]
MEKLVARAPTWTAPIGGGVPVATGLPMGSSHGGSSPQNYPEEEDLPAPTSVGTRTAGGPPLIFSGFAMLGEATCAVRDRGFVGFSLELLVRPFPIRVGPASGDAGGDVLPKLGAQCDGHTYSPRGVAFPSCLPLGL